MDHRRLRERLAAQRSAGDSPVPAPTAVPAADVVAEVDWHARVAHLRGLIRARRQRLEGAVPDLTGPADASPVAGTVATVRAFEDPAMDLGEATAPSGPGDALVSFDLRFDEVEIYRAYRDVWLPLYVLASAEAAQRRVH